MARGWESKSVEAQIESAATPKTAHFSPEIDPARLEIIRKRESLILSRTRVMRQMETAANPRYRAMLRKALADLNARLAELD